MTATLTLLKKKKLALTVTNDLVSDNRVHKVATTLTQMGFEVTLVGRILSDSLPMKPRAYRTHRMSLMVNTGPLFYAFYNISLLFHLLYRRYDVIVSNDLDSLPAGFIYSRMSKKTLVYDSHEYYTEVPELVERPSIQRIWERIEAVMLPKIEYCYTVCQSIADIYNEKYGNNFKVVRNVPFKAKKKEINPTIQLDIPTDLPIILYQGAVNLGRGIEEAILAMKSIDNARLIIVGGGDLLETCQQLVQNEELNDKVIFTGKVPYDELVLITKKATIGISIEKDMGLNYRFALPNKLFDYIQSGIPILASSLPEIKRVVEDYKVGLCIESTTTENIVTGINKMLSNSKKLENWKVNCETAAEELCWENEEKILINIFNNAMRN